MQDGLLALLHRVRSEIVVSRGKLNDISSQYGWEDRIETAEHGLTLVIAYMYNIIQEVEKAKKEQTNDNQNKVPNEGSTET